MTAAAPCPYFEVETAPELQTISLKRDWTFENVPALEEALTHVDPGGADSVLFRCGGLENIDIAGAWVLYRRSESLREDGVETDFKGFKAAHFKFLEQIQRTAEAEPVDGSGRGTAPALAAGIQQLGRSLTRWIDDIGAISTAIFEGVRSPGALALRETLRQLQISGLQAMPVVALISFLMGLVMAYQGALQLKQFGATVFVVDLVAISVLREMGVVMAAIMVAGRSGSAFAASLGVMNLNQETDALRVMGLNPNRILIAPRVLALVIALPLLTVVANIAGLAGGWLVCATLLDMSTSLFLQRLTDATELSTLLVGLSKAPVFALLIGAVATLRGMQVESSAEELGRMTTVAVVQSIFLIVLADGIFTVIFARYGL